MARVHSDRIARNLTIRKYNTLLRLENETIRPNIPLLFRLIINPQDPPPPLPRPALPVQALWQRLVQSSLTETNENR